MVAGVVVSAPYAAAGGRAGRWWEVLAAGALLTLAGIAVSFAVGEPRRPADGRAAGSWSRSPSRSAFPPPRPASQSRNRRCDRDRQATLRAGRCRPPSAAQHREESGGGPRGAVRARPRGPGRRPGRRPCRRRRRRRSASPRPPASPSSTGAKAVNQASTICSGLGSPSWPGSGPSSAVPVLPATCASGIAPAVPVPPVTTPTISSLSWSEIFFDITRVGSASERSSFFTTSGVGSRTPSLATVWETLAISSGVESTSPWPIALTPRSRSSPTSVGMLGSGGSTAAVALGVIEGRLLVEAVALGGADQLVVADLRPERREDRVAGLGEGGAEVSAADLPVGVVDEAAADVDAAGVGEGVVEGDRVRLQGGGGGDDLEGGAGGLWGGEGLPGQRPHGAGAGVEHGDASRSARPAPLTAALCRVGSIVVFTASPLRGSELPRTRRLARRRRRPAARRRACRRGGS